MTQERENEAKENPAMELPTDPSVLQQMVRHLLALVGDRDHVIERLRHQLEVLRRNQFGRKSERINPAQLNLFIQQIETAISNLEKEAQMPPAPVVPPEEKEKPKGHGRKPQPKPLPRKRIEYPIPPEELPCRCCGKMREKIGEEVSEQLEYVPASFLVLEHVRFKYACKHCQENVSIAPAPVKPIEKGLPGPGLLSQVVIAKYEDHQPLNRQAKIYARHGVEISRKTMCGWVKESASLLDPVYIALKKGVLQSKYLRTDDTKVPVLDETREGGTREGHIWTYLGDETAPYVVFDFTPNHSRDGPVAFLDGFSGYLQADAYKGYDEIFRKHPEIIEVGCWAHARRGFYDCRSSDSMRSGIVLGHVRALYMVERAAKHLSPDERKAMRQEKSKSILGILRKWIDEHVNLVLPQSPIREAMGYAINQWTALERYLDDGRLEIDNNASERELRGIALGRRNWLFAGSDEGGRRAAVLYTAIATCKRNGVQPFAYLRDVFSRIGNHPADRIDELMPHNWKRIRQENARGEAATE